MSFPAYSSYKHSGVEWLGQVPADWTLDRLANLYWEAVEPGEDHLPILSVSIHSGVSDEEASPRDSDRKITRSDDRTKYKKVLPGDLVYNMMRAWQGGFGAVQVPGMVSPAYVVARPDKDTSSKYIELLLRTPEAVEEMRRQSRGITDFRLRLYWDEFKNIKVALPSAEEREAILAFLDRETAKIDALIEEQRRLIALLKEKRQAVISHAVTKGFDPHAPMKDSGIEWIGELPAHWEVRKLKSIAQLESGHTPSRQKPEYWIEEECVIPWFTLADVSQLRSGRAPRITITTQHISELGMANSAARLLPAGTVILSRTASVGFAGLTNIDLAVSQDFAAWICGSLLNPEYLLLVLQAMRPEFARLMMGSTHQTIYMPDIEAFRTPLPPPDEQDKIVAHVVASQAEIDRLDDACAASIRLLIERRSALISAAVTGKIDVRPTAQVLQFPVDRVRARGLVATEIIERSTSQPTFGRVKLQKIAFLAEAHVGVSELAGNYVRAAAGPLDSQMIDEMQTGAHHIAGIVYERSGDGAGSQIKYRLARHRGAHRDDLVEWLGKERTALLDKLIADFAYLNTKEAEAVATLYAVWNDMLIDGAEPTDDEIISGFLNDWHEEKPKKFRATDLPEWLGWMRRHGIVPTGTGPKTSTGRLFV